MNPLPAADTGSVESQPVLKNGFIEFADGDREVLPRSQEVGKPQIDRLDILFAAQGENFARGHGRKETEVRGQETVSKTSGRRRSPPAQVSAHHSPIHHSPT